jgi:hypothetical protein
MGRPINKKYFKSGDGNQLGIRAKIGSNAEGNGFILSQRSNKKFKVQVGQNVGICTIVDKANGSLAAGEMTLTVTNDAGAPVRVKKLTNRAAWPFSGGKTPWTFAVSNTDSKVQAADATDPATILVTGPSDVTSTTTASFTLSASTSAGTYTLKYRWQKSTDAGATWTNISNGGVYSGATSAALAISDVTGLDTVKYRATVSATGLTSVESAVATLTVA